MKEVVVMATGSRQFQNNRVLDKEYMRQFPYIYFLTDLAEAIQRAGYIFMTTDVFLKTRPVEKALLVSYSGFGNWLNRREFIPALCFVLEPPIISWFFFHNLVWMANKFHHLFSWRGVSGRLINVNATFHPLFWPNRSRSVIHNNSWSNRDFLVLINNNKRAFQLNWNRISLRNPIKSVAWAALYAYGQVVKHTDPWMKSELYIERLEAIEFFSSRPGFDLFGVRWEQSVPGFERRLRPTIGKCLRGPTNPPGIEPKLNTLSQYKFSLCFENTSFPGYITEKIFDCFFAGTIPVYLGAPDISDYVPAETFIDYRQFKSHDELNDFLNSMSEKEAQNYLDAARQFMASPLFDKFQSNYLIAAMVAALNSVRDQCS